MVARVYGGNCCEPIERACEIWKSGLMLSDFDMSARMPVKACSARKTSLEHSRLKFSSVPGLVRPRASRRAAIEETTSLKAEAIGLLEMAAKRDSDILAGR